MAFGNVFPKSNEYANASTTECLWHEGAQGPLDLGSAPAETEWRRTDAKHISTDTVKFKYFQEVQLWHYLQVQVLRL